MKGCRVCSDCTNKFDVFHFEIAIEGVIYRTHVGITMDVKIEAASDRSETKARCSIKLYSYILSCIIQLSIYSFNDSIRYRRNEDINYTYYLYSSSRASLPRKKRPDCQRFPLPCNQLISCNRWYGDTWQVYIIYGKCRNTRTDFKRINTYCGRIENPPRPIAGVARVSVGKASLWLTPASFRPSKTPCFWHSPN